MTRSSVEAATWKVTAAMLAALFVGAPADGAESQSAFLAGQFVRLMIAKELRTIAARDPATPDRFVAARWVPGVKLLVVSARYIRPARLQRVLNRKDYEEIYIALHRGAITGSTIWFQDLRAGLSKPSQEQGSGLNVKFERGVDLGVFGDRLSAPLRADTSPQFEATKVYYRRLLNLLIGQLSPPALAHASPARTSLAFIAPIKPAR